MSKKPKDIKRMVDMLKQGATLTELSCPACAMPLFRFKTGELWCAKCEKRVIVLKKGENLDEAEGQSKLATLENTIFSKILALEKRIEKEKDTEELQKLNMALASLLENLDKLRKMKEG